MNAQMPPLLRPTVRERYASCASDTRTIRARCASIARAMRERYDDTRAIRNALRRTRERCASAPISFLARSRSSTFSFANAAALAFEKRYRRNCRTQCRQRVSRPDLKPGKRTQFLGAAWRYGETALRSTTMQHGVEKLQQPEERRYCEPRSAHSSAAILLNSRYGR